MVSLQSISIVTPCTGESENIDWIKDLCLVPLFHAPALRDELALHNMNMEEMDLDHLLAELEVSPPQGQVRVTPGVGKSHSMGRWELPQGQVRVTPEAGGSHPKGR